MVTNYLSNAIKYTLQGSEVTISVSDSGVKVDNAKVIKTDIGASNGVIHVIDTVILPR